MQKKQKMEYWLSRTEQLVGEEKLAILKNKNVLIVGLGGVGAYAAEMICRAGISNMTVVDGDTINPSNINRQLPALTSTVGKTKANVMADRLKDINPQLNLRVVSEYMTEDKIEELVVSEKYDYVIDAIDTISPKVQLIVSCLKNNVKVISSMGAGGKFDVSIVKVTDLKKSYNCRLARNIRKRLTKFKIKGGFPVVFSPEDVDDSCIIETEGERNKKSTVGTISYMPAVFGINCAAYVINHFLNE